MKYLKRLICIMLLGQLVVASEGESEGCFSGLRSWWKRTLGTERILLAPDSKAQKRYIFDADKNHEVSLEIWRLQSDMIGVADIQTIDGKRHVQVQRSMSISIDEQVNAFNNFRSELSDNGIKRCLVTLFAVRNERCIVDALVSSHQKEFAKETKGIVPVVCSYVPVGGSEHRGRNHFKYIIQKDKAECELVTPTYDGTVMNIFAMHERKDKRITSPVQGVAVTSSVLADLRETLL